MKTPPIVLLIFVCVAAALLFLAYKILAAVWDFMRQPAFEITGMDVGEDLPPEPRQVDDTLRHVFPGSKPLSVRLRGSVYRYHPKGHLHGGQDFHRLFEDGPWKWQGQQRFAGVFKDKHFGGEYKINAGHYFGVVPSAAKKELLHYVKPEEISNYELVEVEGELDNILDLTDIGHVQKVAGEMAVKGNVHDIFAKLLEEGTGGGEFTDLFGYYARSREYNGILFFSVRALTPEHRRRILESEYWDEVMEDYEKSFVYAEMRRRVGGMCLMVLSGSLLTRSLKRYKFGGGGWEENPYYGWGEGELDKLLEYDSDYQASQGRLSYIKYGDGPESAEGSGDR